MREFLDRRFWVIAWCLIAVMGSIQITTILGETQTWDEGIHLLAGYTYWTKGDYRVNSEHPAFAKMLTALPLLPLRLTVPARDATDAGGSVDAAFQFIYRNRYSPELILALGRSVTIGLTLCFALWIACWTKKRLGSVVAMVALVLFVFDPNITAHGRYVTTDVAAAFFIFLAATLWIDYLLEPSWRRLILAGLGLGCAVTSKYSALFLVPVMLALFVIRAVWVRAETGSFGAFGWKRFAASTAVLALLSVSFIAVVYAPEVLRTRQLPKARQQLMQKGPVGLALWFFAPRLGLRAYSYVIGLDRLSEHDFGGHHGYLLGQESDQGWWYYFPVAYLVKTPVGTIALMAGAIVLAAIGWRRLKPMGFVLTALALTAGVFVFFCIRSHINIGHRHLLPFYAFAYVTSAAAWVYAGPAALRRAQPFVLGGLLLLAAGESIAIYPDYLAFFNFASGGPANGPKYLVDSNLDWGQDFKKMKKWMDAHHARAVCLAFFGNVDGWRYMHNLMNVPDNLEEQKNVDCYVAISATPLYGVYVGRDRYRYFREQNPVARIGYSIYVYDHRRAAR